MNTEKAMMMQELIERLEKAGPDHGLDEAIAELVGTYDAPDRGSPNGNWPHYTSSIDAALTLVPEGCDFYFEVEQVMGGFCNYLYVTGGGPIAPSHDLRGSGGKLHATWKEAVLALPCEISATALKARMALTGMKSR